VKWDGQGEMEENVHRIFAGKPERNGLLARCEFTCKWNLRLCVDRNKRAFSRC